MEVVPLATAADVAVLAADTIEAQVRAHPATVLGLATGSSPLPTYQELIRRHRDGTGPSYDEVRCFTLDEYVGLPAGHPESYRETIFRELTDALGIPRERVASPDAADPEHAGPSYEEAILAAGGVDLQVLGIGADGHLAFNEPGSSLASSTRIKTLTEQTRQDNARFFGSVDEVPHHVLTQGSAPSCVPVTCCSSRPVRARPRRSRPPSKGPLSASCPASVLQLHPHASVLLDDAAASGLARAAHDREVYAAKPDWQGL